MWVSIQNFFLVDTYNIDFVILQNLRMCLTSFIKKKLQMIDYFSALLLLLLHRADVPFITR